MKKAEIDRKLAGIIDPTYVDWINREARMTWHGDLRRRLAGGAQGRRRPAAPQARPAATLEAYCAYLCLRPIENLQKDHRGRRRGVS